MIESVDSLSVSFTLVSVPNWFKFIFSCDCIT